MFNPEISAFAVIDQVILVLPFFFGALVMIYALCKFTSPHKSNIRYWIGGLIALNLAMIFVPLVALDVILLFLSNLYVLFLLALLIGSGVSHYYLRRQHL